MMVVKMEVPAPHTTLAGKMVCAQIERVYAFIWMCVHGGVLSAERFMCVIFFFDAHASV